MRQKTVLQNAIPALVQDNGSLTTKMAKKIDVLSTFLSSVCTHEPPREWKVTELDVTHPIRALEITEHLVKE